MTAPFAGPWALFSKVPTINGSIKLFVYIEDFNSFASDTIKLSVIETKWSILLAGPALLYSLI